jgi:hypothetical protein
MFPLIEWSWKGLRGKKLYLLFKGRVGMGNSTPITPIPLLASPLKGRDV